MNAEQNGKGRSLMKKITNIDKKLTLQRRDDVRENRIKTDTKTKIMRISVNE